MVNKWDYSLNVHNATFSLIRSPPPKMVFEQLPDFNQTYLHVTVGDIDAELTLGCDFKMLHLIPSHITYITLQNLTLDAKFRFDPLYGDHAT